jgi:type IX secretion system PorP/SprF family membrane protein
MEDGSMKKIISILVVFSCITVTTIAQPHINDERGNLNYRDYELLINPAFTDSIGQRMISLGVDKQWAIEGAPLTEFLQFQMPVAQTGNIGAWLHNDSYGVENDIQIGAAYSYKIKIKDNFLSFGLSLSLLMMGESRVAELNDSRPDPVFSEPLSGQTGFNAGFGAYYFSNKFYAGFSIPQLLTNDIKNYKLENSIDFARAQYYFTGGYRFDMSNTISLMPSALLALSGATSLGYEVMLTAAYNKRFEIGAGWSANANLQFAAGAAITKSISLRYQFSQNIDADYHAGTSHFIVLRYAWGGKKTTAE